MSAPPQWTIRAADAQDADALSLIGRATFLESYAGIVDGQAIIRHCSQRHSAQSYRALLCGGGKAWLAQSEPGAAPVGYVVLCNPDLEQARPGDIELLRIYVLARFYGSGLAHALMQEVIAAARGHDRILLGVKNDNHRALAFYRKHGFAEIGTRTFSVACESYDDFVLARPLNPDS